MELTEALEIVLDLAQQNVADDPEMADELERQEKAVEIVRRLQSPTVVVIVHGGIVQEIVSDNSALKSIVIDFDMDGVSENDAKNDDHLFRVGLGYASAWMENATRLTSITDKDAINGINHAYQLSGEQPRIIKSAYTSEWETGEKVTSGCHYDRVTKTCYNILVTGHSPDGVLLREYVTLPDGKELDESDGVTFDY